MNEALYKSVFEHSPMGYAYHKILFDTNGNPSDYEVLAVNPAFERLTGLKAASVVGRKASEIYEKAEVDSYDWRSLFRNVSELSGTAKKQKFINWYNQCLELTITSPDKDTLLVAILPNNTMKGDQPDKEKRENAENLERFFSLNLDLLCIADTDGRFLKLNRMWEEILGYPTEELEKSYFLDFVHPDDHEATILTMGILSEQKQVLNFTNRYRCKDGSYRHIEWRSQPSGNLIYAAARDITDKKVILTELEDRKRFLKSILDAIPEAVFFKNRDSVYIGCNKAFLEIFGLSDEKEVIGKTDLGFFNPDVSDKNVQQDLKIMSTRLAQKNEIVIDTSNGFLRDFETIKTPFYNEKDEVAGVIGISRDITQRKLMEMYLKESEERYAAIVNSAPEIVLIHKKGKIVFINQSGVEASGYERNELIGQDILDFVTEQTKDTIISAMKMRAINEPVGDYEIEFITKQGDIISLFVKTTAITYEKEPALLAVLIDITERTRIEKQLRASEMRLSLATSSGNIALWDWNVKTGEVIINDRWAEIVGYTTEELEPISITTWERLTHPEDLEYSNTLINQCFSGQQDFYDCQVRMKHKNGEWVWIYDRGRVIEWDHQKKPIRMIGIHIDITKQKQVEEQLDLAREAAETANRLKSQFLANMSHEIRTPMNGVLGFLNLLENTNLSREQREYVHEAKSASDMLLYLINDILDLSKIEAGKMTLEKIPYSIKTTLEDAVSLMVPKAVEKGIHLKLEMMPDLPDEMEGDPVRLRQILHNLIGNAVKFTGRGEIRVNAEVVQRTKNQVKIAIHVKDTGIGISSENIKKIFKPFAQADASTTRKYGGSGLGLAISNQLAKMMGGEIVVDSKPDMGSVFTLTIVSRISHRTNDNTAMSVDTGEVKLMDHEKDRMIETYKPRILLAEDNEINVKVVSLMLKSNKLSCDVVADGKEAVEAVSRNNYDIVFMDCQMPVMDGYEASAEIREMEGVKKHTAIVAMTANAMEGDREKCLEAGMDDYLSKPIIFEKMLDMIKKYTRYTGGKQLAFIQESMDQFVKSTGFPIDDAKELYDQYIKSIPDILKDMSFSLQSGDLQKLRQQAHKLKGSSGALQINSMFDQMHKIELSAMNNEIDKCSELIERVKKTFSL